MRMQPIKDFSDKKLLDMYLVYINVAYVSEGGSDETSGFMNGLFISQDSASRASVDERDAMRANGAETTIVIKKLSDYIEKSNIEADDITKHLKGIVNFVEVPAKCSFTQIYPDGKVIIAFINSSAADAAEEMASYTRDFSVRIAKYISVEVKKLEYADVEKETYAVTTVDKGETNFYIYTDLI